MKQEPETNEILEQYSLKLQKSIHSRNLTSGANLTVCQNPSVN